MIITVLLKGNKKWKKNNNNISLKTTNGQPQSLNVEIFLWTSEDSDLLVAIKKRSLDQRCCLDSSSEDHSCNISHNTSHITVPYHLRDAVIT